MFCCMFVLFSGTEVRFVSGVGEEVDEGYLETYANLVSVVSTLSFLFPLSPCWSDLSCAQQPFTLFTAAQKQSKAKSVFSF